MKGSGQVDKIAFRRGVKKMVNTFTYKEVDALFHRCDSDGSGALDTRELQQTLAMLAKVTWTSDHSGSLAARPNTYCNSLTLDSCAFCFLPCRSDLTVHATGGSRF